MTRRANAGLGGPLASLPASCGEQAERKWPDDFSVQDASHCQEPTLPNEPLENVYVW